VGPCPHSMARPQVADGGTASSYGRELRIYWTKGGRLVGVLDVGLTTLHHKK
jgi:hypothetical protein